MQVVPNQSYLLKQMQFRCAAALATLLHDFGSNNRAIADAWFRQPNDTCYWPTGWRVDNEKFWLRRRDGDGRSGLAFIKFSAARWDPQNSNLNYGDKTIAENINEHNDSKTKIIRNETDGDVHVAYNESVDLTNSFSSSITKGVTLDVTESAEVASEQKVSAEYAGVSAEVSLSEKFGISKDKTQTSEEGKEKSEEGTYAESIAVDFIAKEHNNYLIEITKEHERTQQPFDIDGVMDFDAELHGVNYVRGLNSHYRPHGNVKLSGVDAVLQFVHGYDTNYPELQGYWDHASDVVKRAIDWISVPAHRRIQVSGINYANLESNADYSVESLGTDIPDELAHLPIVDAKDVAA